MPKPHGISSFSGQSFAFAAVMGRAYANQSPTISSSNSSGQEGDDGGLAHMHLDSFTPSEASHQADHAGTHAASTFVNASSISSDDSASSNDSSDDEGEGDGDDDGASFSGAPTFLLADGTPGIEGIGDDGGDGDGGDGDGGDGD